MGASQGGRLELMVLSRRLPSVLPILLVSVCLEPVQRLPLWFQATLFPSDHMCRSQNGTVSDGVSCPFSLLLLELL